jgi:hypothetical protein
MFGIDVRLTSDFEARSLLDYGEQNPKAGNEVE